MIDPGGSLNYRRFRNIFENSVVPGPGLGKFEQNYSIVKNRDKMREVSSLIIFKFMVKTMGEIT